jgi:hypothetical protein
MTTKPESKGGRFHSNTKASFREIQADPVLSIFEMLYEANKIKLSRSMVPSKALNGNGCPLSSQKLMRLLRTSTNAIIGYEVIFKESSRWKSVLQVPESPV